MTAASQGLKPADGPSTERSSVERSMYLGQLPALPLAGRGQVGARYIPHAPARNASSEEMKREQWDGDQTTGAVETRETYMLQAEVNILEKAKLQVGR